MVKEPRGRLYQDTEFVFPEFDGLKIEQLIVCEDIVTKEPVLIFFKVIGKNWHQYFLDAGIGFWEDWNKTEIIEEEENCENFCLFDATDKFNIKNKTISKIIGEKDGNNSKITIELEDRGKLILKCINPEIFDSECELVRV